MLCGTDIVLRDNSMLRLDVEIFCRILSVLDNIVMDLNNVMHGPSF